MSWTCGLSHPLVGRPRFERAEPQSQTIGDETGVDGIWEGTAAYWRPVGPLRIGPIFNICPHDAAGKRIVMQPRRTVVERERAMPLIVDLEY